jgi:hypothetical protein
MDEYDGRQFVWIDLHRRRSVIVRQSESPEQLSAVRIVNDPVALALQLEQAGSAPGGGAGSDPTAGIGPLTCCRPAERMCIWRIRWESRDSATGG